MRAFDIAVFDRVVVDIIEVPNEADVVTDRLFPGPPLPDAVLALCEPGMGASLFLASGGEERSGEGEFDGAYTLRGVGVAAWQR